jgi:DNA-binding NarL/FixJ family response regulator
MSAVASRKQFVWQVVAPDDRAKGEMEAWVHRGGFAVLDDARLAPNQQLGSVTATVRITPREHKVLEALVSCDTAAAIAAALVISVKAVENHLQRLMRKLRVHSRHRLIAEAVRQQLLIIEPRA